MKINLNIFIFLMICVPLTRTIFVPENTRTNTQWNIHSGNYMSEKQLLQRGLKQSVRKLNNCNNDGNNDMNNDDQKTFNGQQAIKKTHQLSPIPIEEKSYDINDDVFLSKKNCTANAYENLEAQPTGLTEQQKHKLHNNDVENKTIEEQKNNNTLHQSRRRRQLSDFLIAPNTKWCGRGNAANGTYNHLGGASKADKCCRRHDHCKIFIPAMGNRFGLFNYRPYTLSHCNCDSRFRTCLKMAKDDIANTIGKLFFNFVQTKCLKVDKKVICQERAEDGSCLKKQMKRKAFLWNNLRY